MTCRSRLSSSAANLELSNESLFYGGEVCLWAEYTDDANFLTRLWYAVVVVAAAVVFVAVVALLLGFLSQHWLLFQMSSLPSLLLLSLLLFNVKLKITLVHVCNENERARTP